MVTVREQSCEHPGTALEVHGLDTLSRALQDAGSLQAALLLAVPAG